MNLQLEDHIYRWLFNLDIIPGQSRKLKNGKIEIPLTQTTALETGHLLLKLLHSINNAKSLNLKLPTQNNLKVFAIPQDKLYNWNLLSDILKSMGYEVNPEMKRLIVSGNKQSINDLLKDLYELFNEDSSKKIQTKTSLLKSRIDTTTLINNTSLSKSLLTNESLIKNQSMIIPKESIDISKLDVTKPLNQTESLLEFLIISLSKNLNLKGNQVIFFCLHKIIIIFRLLFFLQKTPSIWHMLYQKESKEISNLS